MSVKRLYHWSCDFCDVWVQDVTSEEPGLPEGWISTTGKIRNGEISPTKHACGSCRSSVPREDWHPRWKDYYSDETLK